MAEPSMELSNLSPQEKRRLLGKMLARQAGEKLYPLSYSQRAMWFLYKVAPQSSAYNVSFAARLCSEVNVAALRRSFDALISRHGVLRSTFTMQGGQPFQKISSTGSLLFEQVEAASWNETMLCRCVSAAHESPCNLEQGPQLRVKLFTRSPIDHALLITAHHILFDGWSVWILLDELRALYEAECSGSALKLKTLNAQYSDFVDWEHRMLTGEQGEGHWAYWQKQLAGELPMLEMPIDRPRPPKQTYHGATEPFRLGISLTARLKEFSAAEGITHFVMLLAAYQALLHRYSGQEEILVGSPTTGRSRAEFAGVIGDFVNMVVLRSRMDCSTTFRTFVQQVRNTVLEALAHQEYPFALLVEKLGVARDPSRSPVFQTAFILQKTQRSELAALFDSTGTAARVNLGGLEIETYPLVQQAGQFDLTLELAEGQNQFVGNFKYNTDLFDRTTIQRMAVHFQKLLEGMLDGPDRGIATLHLLTDAERRQLLVEWNDTTVAYPGADLCLHQLIEMQAAKNPDHIAVVVGQQSLTYGELDRRANQLAHHLHKLGVGPEVRAGLLVERSPDMLVSILGVLKAGGAYVPLDPSFPQNRLAFMVKDSKMSVMLTHHGLEANLPERPPVVLRLDSDWSEIATQSTTGAELPATAQANLAYVLYTSGSTGMPKGVAIPHSAIVNFLLSMQRTPGFDPNDVLLAVTTLSFDIAGLELYLPLISGGRVIIAAREDTLDPIRLKARIIDSGCTVMQATPATWRALIQAGWSGSSHLKVLCGGEALPSDLAKDLLPRCAELWNMYGPTETTVWSTVQRVTSGQGPIAIGRPIANTQVYVLNEHQVPMPQGVVGELFIGGDGLARGYLHREDLTQERFVPDPFRPDSRLYRTGDLARWLADGTLDCVGRVDNQVKLRGFRIELGEIEAALSRLEGVAQSVVAVREDIPGDKHLVAYVVPKIADSVPQSEIDGSERNVDFSADIARSEDDVRRSPVVSAANLREALESTLPEYMIPSTFTFLPALPLTPNGKVDRKALPAPERNRQSGKPFVAPRNDIERQIAEIWKEMLHIPQAGIYDSYYELGGNSLRAMEVVFKIQESLNTQLGLSDFLSHPTIASLASFFAGEQSARAVGQDVPSFRDSSSELRSMLEIRPEERHEPFPLTDVQEAYWIGRGSGYELSGVSTHVYWEADIDDLDISRYENTWQLLIDRHEMLRAIILPDGRQQILQSTPPFKIRVLDLCTQSAEFRQNALEAVRRELSHQVLPSDQWPLFEIRACKLNNRRYRLHFSFDALIGDGWSWQILQGEFNDLYNHPDSGYPPLELSFRDYVLAITKFKESGTYRESLAYWNDRLKSLPARPELPIAKSPASITKPNFSSRQDKVDAKLWEGLQERAAAFGITPNGLLLAAFADVLATWSKQSRFLINLTLFNRFPIHPQVENLVGDFTSLTLLEVDLSTNDSFQELARKLLDRLWKDLDHRFVGGVQVMRNIAHDQPDRRGTVAPVVFTSATSFRSQEFSPSFLAGRGETVYAISQTPQVWLDHLVSVDDRGNLSLSWFYVEDLFPHGMIDDMFGSYISHLRRLAIDESAWLETRAQRVAKLIPEWQLLQRKAVNDTAKPVSDKLLHVLFENQASLTPDATAVCCGDTRLTYLELLRMSRLLGRQLREKGARPNMLVAIVMEKGWEQVVAALGILQSGAAYVPLDANIPQERLSQLLRDAQVELVITQARFVDTVEWPDDIRLVCVEGREVEQKDAGPLASIQRPEDLAYVIYTSGSTGLPKGVMIDHRGAVNTILDINERFHVSTQDRVLALSSLSFDLSVYDIFGMLAAGAAIVIPEPHTARDPACWADLTRREQVSIWNSVPALMEMFVEYLQGRSERLPSSLRLVMMSGDWIPVTLPSQIRNMSQELQLISLGGATEASIWSILHPIDQVDPAWSSIPYGRPMVNHRFYVLNDALDPCPVWVPGQLFIGGIGVALGYWQDEEKTKAKFIIHPRTGEALYCTGDLGRYLPGGDIEFMGREDFQVKIRGFRIELGEIEAALKQHPAVRSAVVSAIGNTNAEKRLVAYVAPTHEGEDPGISAESNASERANESRTKLGSRLKSFLANKLPDYMMPANIVVLDEIPLTPNGKVNRSALPAPENDRQAEQDHLPPGNPTECTIAEIWQQLLGVEKIGIHDNFFELGGHSLIAIQAISRMREAFQQDVPVRLLFESLTVAEIAKHIDALRWATRSQQEAHAIEHFDREETLI